MITKYKQFNESIKSLLVGPTKEDMEEYWKSLGYDKSFDTADEFMLNLIDGMKIKEHTKYINSVIWEKDGKIIFQQDLKGKKIYVDYNSLWLIIGKLFGLNQNEIKSFLLNFIEKHLNWTGYSISFVFGFKL